jgi:hypothetical protein
MKKIAILSILSVFISFLACKKDPFFQTVDDLDALDLPQNLIGKWRLIALVGGFTGGGKPVDSTKQFVLTMAANKTYQWCVNQDCESAKWFYGSKLAKNGRDSVKLLVFEPLKTNSTPFNLAVSHTTVVNDTLLLGLYCNDCFEPVFVKVR